jgi:hypothetical protein
MWLRPLTIPPFGQRAPARYFTFWTHRSKLLAQADELRRMAPSVISTAVRDPLLVRRSPEPASLTANGPAGMPSGGEYSAEPVRTIREASDVSSRSGAQRPSVGLSSRLPA